MKLIHMIGYVLSATISIFLFGRSVIDARFSPEKTTNNFFMLTIITTIIITINKRQFIALKLTMQYLSLNRSHFIINDKKDK